MTKKSNIKSIPGQLLSSSDIAIYCQVSVMQVNRWMKKGALKAFRNPGGRYRILKKDFKEFLEHNGMPVVDEYFEEERNRRILIADDDEELVKGIHHLIISSYGEVEVENVYDGYEALIKTGDFKPDLLIIDIMMPKIDGLEVCRRIRASESINPGMKILSITGHSETYDREMVMEAGADEYLLKPLDTAKLLELIEKLI